MRKAALSIVFLNLLHGQTFEVASLKMHPASVLAVSGIQPRPGGTQLKLTAALSGFLAIAYNTRLDRISGGPSWVRTTLWDVNAKAAKPSSVEDLRMMLGHLLSERFKLKLGHQPRMDDVYILMVDKQGFKGKASAGGGNAKIDLGWDEKLQQLRLTVTSSSIEEFLARERAFIPLQVQNQTGLVGTYDFSVHYRREGGPTPYNPEGTQPVYTGPTLVEALSDQLGLRFQKVKSSVDSIVISHAEQPLAN
jgi:uncharacterized protein (TIGR03435 family)